MNQNLRQVEPIILGKNICALRLEKNMTQDEVARSLQLRNIDMSRSTYAKIELGIRHVTTVELEGIRDILETDYDTLFQHTSGAEQE
ncbi:MAG: helix-turn-helix domain-containing protein [Lachnospiraceae bacterium]|nr:helix-turn-helix domain-containing protein [Lachnospiraceae bacterium]